LPPLMVTGVAPASEPQVLFDRVAEDRVTVLLYIPEPESVKFVTASDTMPVVL